MCARPGVVEVVVAVDARDSPSCDRVLRGAPLSAGLVDRVSVPPGCQWGTQAFSPFPI